MTEKDGRGILDVLMFRTPRRPFIIGIVVTIVAIVMFGWFMVARKSRTNDTIVTAPVVQKIFTKTVESSGKTKAKRQAELKFQTAGRLTWVGVTEGETVTVGQAIAKLDVREVQKTLEKYLTDYSRQRNDYEELWRVTYKGTQNPQEALTDTAKRILEKNQWDLNKTILDVELKAIAVEYATLTSPIDGIVTNLASPVAGVNITATTVIAEVADPESLVFEANIDETDIGHLELGQQAVINLDAFPNTTFSGRISNIAYASVTSSGGATVFPVEVSFDTPERLRIGLNGDVTITVQTIDQAVVLPLTALREEEGETYVYKKTKDTYQKTRVIAGEKTDEEAVITEGLAVGDEVVVKGFTLVSLKQ